MKKKSRGPLCEAAVGSWESTMAPMLCGKPGQFIRNPDPHGWPAHYRLCEEHKALAQQRGKQ